MAEEVPPTRLTPMQRLELRKLRRVARKAEGEPLSPEDWGTYWELMCQNTGWGWRRLMHVLPASPRCMVCQAPFRGLGHRVVAPLGFTQSRKNPNLCATCVELSPPGGVAMRVGILFVDIRGFTARSERAELADTVGTLRRFYACAEETLFPEALIDKLIGDEVMALYLPAFSKGQNVAEVMLEHARRLLGRIGYGTAEGPFIEAGIGLDYGDAFVGNIGDRNIYDFTAVGDVVNTASRLQGAAAGGEVLFSERIADELAETGGERIALELKGKAEVENAYRLSG